LLLLLLILSAFALGRRKATHKCHIISKANGGSNDKRNLYECPAVKNMKRKHYYDHLNCQDVGLKRCEAAIASSPWYKGPSAKYLLKMKKDEKGHYL
ncbi:hypothetical protein BCR33DRAFT_712765, partial [Rhizoclosmatium globosum]